MTFTRRYTFPEFVAKFPPVTMPVTLGEDTHHTFSSENEPLPDDMIAQHILPTNPAEQLDDEFTEYVPCFGIENTSGFIALVWWRAGLLHYEYVLATFTEHGGLIDRQVIAFTRVTDGRTQRAVATIDEDWIIFIAEGEGSGADDYMDPTTSRTYEREIMTDGKII